MGKIYSGQKARREDIAIDEKIMRRIIDTGWGGMDLIDLSRMRRFLADDKEAEVRDEVVNSICSVVSNTVLRGPWRFFHTRDTLSDTVPVVLGSVLLYGEENCCK
jgi:hypothetical protein